MDCPKNVKQTAWTFHQTSSLNVFGVHTWFAKGVFTLGPHPGLILCSFFGEWFAYTNNFFWHWDNCAISYLTQYLTCHTSPEFRLAGHSWRVVSYAGRVWGRDAQMEKLRSCKTLRDINQTITIVQKCYSLHCFFLRTKLFDVTFRIENV